MASRTTVFQDYAQWLLPALQENTSERDRAQVIEALAALYQEQRQRQPAGPTSIERLLYGWLTDPDQSAAVHRAVLQACVRFAQVDQALQQAAAPPAEPSSTALVPAALDLAPPSNQPTPSTGPLFALSIPSHYRPIVQHLLPLALALEESHAGWLDCVLDRWDTQGEEVSAVARQLRRAMRRHHRNQQVRRIARPLATALLWMAFLAVALLLCSLVCITLYEAGFDSFLRRYIF